MQVKKQQLDLDMKKTDTFQIGKGVCKAVYCYSAYLTYMHSTLCEIPSWLMHQLESRLLGEMSVTSDTQVTPPL